MRPSGVVEKGEETVRKFWLDMENPDFYKPEEIRKSFWWNLKKIWENWIVCGFLCNWESCQKLLVKPEKDFENVYLSSLHISARLTKLLQKGLFPDAFK